MNKKQKIKLLHDLLQGKKKISDLSPFIAVTFHETIIGKGGKVLRVEKETVMIERERFE